MVGYRLVVSFDVLDQFNFQDRWLSNICNVYRMVLLHYDFYRSTSTTFMMFNLISFCDLCLIYDFME